MKTRRSLFGLVPFAFFLLPGHASAAPPCPAAQPVYISSGSQILCVETTGTPGKVTVLLTHASSTFEDIAFGPDGLLYFTDSVGARVFRFDPKSNAASATLVANIPSGTPKGLSFSSSNGTSNGDLYVNSSTGVWLVAGVTHIADNNLPTPPTEVITFGSSIAAGGNGFDLLSAGTAETQLIVDQTHNQILQATFPFTSAKSLTSVNSIGPGIFANFCGDALVASGTTIQRVSFSFDNNGNLVVSSPSTYASFGQSNKVRYFEVTADNTLLVATFANGAGGIIWQVVPVKGADGVPSCSATPTVTTLVSLKSALQAKTPPDLASDVANGVALPPTPLTVTANFDPAHPSQTFNFGLHRVIVTYKQVLESFAQSFTAIRSRPDDVAFSAAFQPGTTAIHINPFGGFTVQYVTPEMNAPVGGMQYAPSTPGTFDAIQIKSVYSTSDLLLEPGLAHAAGDALLGTPQALQTYTDNITHDFWLADDTDAGSAGGWNSEFVDFNQTLKQNLTFTLKSPVSSCGSTTTPTCNPQFNIGQNVDFGFNTSPASLPITARLSIAKVHVAADGSIAIDQTINVFSKNNNDVDNFFDPTNNTYNWDSSGAATAGPGLYQATIFSDSFAPQVVFLTLK